MAVPRAGEQPGRQTPGGGVVEAAETWCLTGRSRTTVDGAAGALGAAAGMAEVARLLLEKNHKGILFQSQIDTVDYLNGPFVGAIYGERR